MVGPEATRNFSVVGRLVANRRGQLVPFRTKDDPPTGGQGRSHDGKMLIVGAIELGDGNIPGRLRVAEISSYDLAADLGHFVETAAGPDAIAENRTRLATGLR